MHKTLPLMMHVKTEWLTQLTEAQVRFLSKPNLQFHVQVSSPLSLREAGNAQVTLTDWVRQKLSAFATVTDGATHPFLVTKNKPCGVNLQKSTMREIVLTLNTLRSQPLSGAIRAEVVKWADQQYRDIQALSSPYHQNLGLQNVKLLQNALRKLAVSPQDPAAGFGLDRYFKDPIDLTKEDGYTALLRTLSILDTKQYRVFLRDAKAAQNKALGEPGANTQEIKTRYALLDTLFKDRRTSYRRTSLIERVAAWAALKPGDAQKKMEAFINKRAKQDHPLAMRALYLIVKASPPAVYDALAPLFDGLSQTVSDEYVTTDREKEKRVCFAPKTRTKDWRRHSIYHVRKQSSSVRHQVTISHGQDHEEGTTKTACEYGRKGYVKPGMMRDEKTGQETPVAVKTLFVNARRYDVALKAAREEADKLETCGVSCTVARSFDSHGNEKIMLVTPLHQGPTLTAWLDEGLKVAQSQSDPGLYLRYVVPVLLTLISTLSHLHVEKKMRLVDFNVNNFIIQAQGGRLKIHPIDFGEAKKICVVEDAKKDWQALAESFVQGCKRDYVTLTNQNPRVEICEAFDSLIENVSQMNVLTPEHYQTLSTWCERLLK